MATRSGDARGANMHATMYMYNVDLCTHVNVGAGRQNRPCTNVDAEFQGTFSEHFFGARSKSHLIPWCFCESPPSVERSVAGQQSRLCTYFVDGHA